MSVYDEELVLTDNELKALKNCIESLEVLVTYHDICLSEADSTLEGKWLENVVKYHVERIKQLKERIKKLELEM